MTENEAFDLLRSYLLKLDEDAARISPEWPKLADIIRSSRDAIQPREPYADIQLISVRDSKKARREDYESVFIDGAKTIVLNRSLAWNWLFRVRVFGGKRVENLKLFNTALKSQFADVELYPLSVAEVSDIRIAHWQTANAWEGQSHIDVSLNGLSAEKMIVDTVEDGRLTIIDDTRGIETEAIYQKD